MWQSLQCWRGSVLISTAGSYLLSYQRRRSLAFSREKGRLSALRVLLPEFDGRWPCVLNTADSRQVAHNKGGDERQRQHSHTWSPSKRAPCCLSHLVLFAMTSLLVALRKLRFFLLQGCPAHLHACDATQHLEPPAPGRPLTHSRRDPSPPLTFVPYCQVVE